MRKSELLNYWKRLRRGPIMITPIPYKSSGSTYEMDGIRITGSPTFVDSILARLQELLVFENEITRLQVSYKETEDREARKRGESIKTGSVNCYIQVAMRGPQAQAANVMFTNMKDRTRR